MNSMLADKNRVNSQSNFTSSFYWTRPPRLIAASLTKTLSRLCTSLALNRDVALVRDAELLSVFARLLSFSSVFCTHAEAVWPH